INVATTLDFELDWTDDVLDEQPSRPLRFLPEGGAVVEITARTLHGFFLLKPGTRANELILGVLGHALAQFPQVRLHGFWFLSNHFNLLGFFPNAFIMAAFMNLFNSCLARELGRLYGWKEKFFGRRYRAIVLADSGAQVPRFAYLLSQGTKEGLVARPDLWPGAKCLGAVLRGERVQGVWVDRTAMYEARAKKKDVREKDFETIVDVPLHPLPIWERLPETERQRRTAEIIDAIERKAESENRRLRRKPLGAEKILSQDPHDSPKNFQRTPAPMCHASSRSSFWSFADAYRAFLADYRAASRALREGDRDAVDRFPPRCFRPGVGSPPAAASQAA
ncbi:MAG: hypothetical protein ACRD16_06845, partial [Thermoanaerobaculia bacterium]